jgi:hypothetical protein
MSIAYVLIMYSTWKYVKRYGAQLIRDDVTLRVGNTKAIDMIGEAV